MIVVVVACSPAAPPPPAAAPSNCQPLQGASPGASAALNSSGLAADPLQSPIAPLTVAIGAPQLGEQIAVEQAGAYEVKWQLGAPTADGSSVEIALDGARPRRFPATRAAVSLGELLPSAASLQPGSHWLFVAPVLASGLVPRPAAGAPRAAVARHFFVGAAPNADPGPSGAIWLRKPEGTYNGAHDADSVLFDVFVFSASGAPLEPPYTVLLEGAGRVGELRFPSPFAVHDLPSGDYQAAVSAPGAAPSSVRFTVNRELGAPQ